MILNKRIWLSSKLILCIAIIIFLGMHPLLVPNGLIYAENYTEIMRTQTFIAPQIYRDFRYDNSPIYYWLVAVPFKIFEMSEFFTRFSSTVFAVSGSFLVYFSGRKLFGKGAGMFATLILATSLEYFYISNADMTLTFYLTAALLAFLHEKYYLLYGISAIATLAKGPIIIFFCGVIIILYLFVMGSLNKIKSMKIISKSVLLTLIIIPWCAAMYSFHGMTIIETFLCFQNATSFLQPDYVAGVIWYYYIPGLILMFFLWSVILPHPSELKEKGTHYNTCVFLVIWAAVMLVFFLTSQTKSVFYVFSIYPPLALLTGYYFNKVWIEKH